MNHTFSKTWLIVILAIFIAGGILAWQYWGVPKKGVKAPEEEVPKEEVIEDETANWNTYRNEEGGYLFKYPKEWNAVTNKYNSKNTLFGPEATNESGYGGVEFCGTLSSGQSLKDFVKESNSGVESGSISEIETTVNGQIVIISILPKAAIEPTEVKSVSFEKDGKVFSMFLIYKTNFTQYPEDKQRLTIFNQMLSTFRFIREDETANWNTYRNEEYGFEIKYPANWKVAKNTFNLEPNLVFCPFSLTDPDPEIVCKLKTDTTKPQYEEGMIYLFAYNNDPKPNNPKYHYLGSASGKYYYLYSESNELIVNQMLSTFRFIREDETANWNTYRNEEYGFEIKYPKDFSFKEIIPLESAQISFPKSEHSFSDILIATRDFIEGKRLNKEECIFGEELNEKNLLSFRNTEEINGVVFYYYSNYPEFIGAYCGMESGCQHRDVYRTYYEEYCYEITLVRWENPKKGIVVDERTLKSFTQILSTFRFLE